ncbi:unnamed protein product [Blepharisma stoltei]|uniref:RecA family profile 1 domain-containing protein n=1 Tax=Blepharisma stoltei TaxID=1481888 RepID=A0AAU9K2U0_9CILI|nr:unnamed protein product [Blepharisma stoltei]
MEWPEWWNQKAVTISVCNLAELGDDRFVKTNIGEFDQFIGGGFLPGSIYELVGESASGKTNLALAISKEIVMQHYKVCYFSTQKPLSVARLQSMNLDSNCFVYRNAVSQDDKCRYFIQELKSVIDCLEDVKLIVLDNIPELFSDYENTPNGIKLRNTAITKISVLLKHLSHNYGFGILIINNVTSDMHGALNPKLGLIWTNMVTHRMFLSKQNTLRTLKIQYSSIVGPENELHFLINDQGIELCQGLSQQFS